jgi:hypothetical protein
VDAGEHAGDVREIVETGGFTQEKRLGDALLDVTVAALDGAVLVDAGIMDGIRSSRSDWTRPMPKPTVLLIILSVTGCDAWHNGPFGYKPPTEDHPNTGAAQTEQRDRALRIRQCGEFFYEGPEPCPQRDGTHQ